MGLLKTYPKRIYVVHGNGMMLLYLKIDAKYLKTKPYPEFGEPYEEIRMLEMPNDDIGWKMRDYESELPPPKGRGLLTKSIK